VADQQHSILQEHIRLHTAKAAVERVEQWVLMMIIVVGVSTEERL